jgi:hypothetical protein
MKQPAANPSPLKPFLGIHDGKLAVFVSAFPLSLLTPRHYRESAPPTMHPESEPTESLKTLERYLSR